MHVGALAVRARLGIPVSVAAPVMPADAQYGPNFLAELATLTPGAIRMPADRVVQSLCPGIPGRIRVAFYIYADHLARGRIYPHAQPLTDGLQRTAIVSHLTGR